MLNILVPVDGSDNADRAVAYASRLSDGSTPIHIHLLNVQTPVRRRASVSRLISQSMIDEFYTRAGKTSLDQAQVLLKKTGIPYSVSLEFGSVAQQIIAYAHDNACDRIVMGTRGNSAMINMLIGSVANQVLHLAQIPVTLIK